MVSVSPDGDMPVDRSAYMNHCVTLCLRSVWQVETENCFRWHMRCTVTPWGDALWCRPADVFLDTAAALAPKSHNTAPRAFHLTEPDHWS